MLYLELVIRIWAFGLIFISRELVEDAELIFDLRTCKIAGNWADILVYERRNGSKLADGKIKEVWNTFLQEAEGKTSEVVALEKVGSVEDSAREIFQVNADERVWLAGVTTELQSLGSLVS